MAMPELGLTKVNELSATRINTFLDEKISRGRVDGSGGLSASYVRSIMLVINAAIKYAVSEQLCSPLKTPICKPSVDKTELSILSSEEQNKLETSLLNNFDLTGAGIYISLHTGLRIGEVCSLAWNDIDMNKRVIHVRHTVARIRSGNSGGSTILIIDTPKTKASKRDIPISSTLLPILLNSTEDMLSRLETMVLQGAAGLPLEAIRQQIASAVDIIIHLSRLRDKSRKTMEITEVVRYENGKIILNPLYVFEEDENSTLDKVSGQLKRTSNPMQNTFKLQLSGFKAEI